MEGGRAWFLSTLPQATHSSLSRDGISFYVLLHRAIELGASALGDARNLDAGPDSLGNATEWMALSIEDGSTLSTHSLHAGAFVEKDENKMVALNRPQEEDEPKVIGDEDLAMILEGIEYKRIDDAAGSLKPLTAEIWKTFLLAASLASLQKPYFAYLVAKLISLKPYPHEWRTCICHNKTDCRLWLHTGSRHPRPLHLESS